MRLQNWAKLDNVSWLFPCSSWAPRGLATRGWKRGLENSALQIWFDLGSIQIRIKIRRISFPREQNAPNIGMKIQIGLYRRVVTYFFLYRWVAESTMTPSLMERAYRWFSITWLGSGNNVGSHWKKKWNKIWYSYGKRLLLNEYLIKRWIFQLMHSTLGEKAETRGTQGRAAIQVSPPKSYFWKTLYSQTKETTNFLIGARKWPFTSNPSLCVLKNINNSAQPDSCHFGINDGK